MAEQIFITREAFKVKNGHGVLFLGKKNFIKLAIIKTIKRELS
jgi:hypothetical protein